MFDLDRMEQALSCATLSLEGSDGTEREYLVVGTARVKAEEAEASEGRILVFAMNEERRSAELVAEKEAKGAVYSIGGLKGRLVAGVGSKVR